MQNLQEKLCEHAKLRSLSTAGHPLFLTFQGKIVPKKNDLNDAEKTWDSNKSLLLAKLCTSQV